MQRRIFVTLALFLFSAACMTGCKKENAQTTETSTGTSAPAGPAASPVTAGETAKTGEQLYKQYCAACHPNGSNTINPQKPLRAKEMAQHNIAKPEDIVRVMRNPGPGMNKFNEAIIPDNEARMIGEYILTTFK